MGERDAGAISVRPIPTWVLPLRAHWAGYVAEIADDGLGHVWPEYAVLLDEVDDLWSTPRWLAEQQADQYGVTVEEWLEQSGRVLHWRDRLLMKRNEKGTQDE